MKRNQSYIVLILLLVVLFPRVAMTDVSFGEKIVVKIGKTMEEAVSFLHDVYVYGTVKEAAVAIGGDIFVESGGNVRGDAVALFGDIFVRNNGKIRGDAVTLGGRTHRDFGSDIHGEIVTLFPDIAFVSGTGGCDNNITKILKFIVLGPIIGIFGIVGAVIVLVFSLLKLLLFLGIAALFTYFFPQNILNMAEFTQREYVKSFLIGFAVIIAIPFMIIALLVTIIGIPVIPAFLLFLFLTYLYGSTGIALWTGRLLPNGEHRSEMWNVVIGVLILGIVKLIPGIGFFIKFVILAVSFGIVIFTRFGSRSPESV